MRRQAPLSVAFLLALARDLAGELAGALVVASNVGVSLAPAGRAIGGLRVCAPEVEIPDASQTFHLDSLGLGSGGVSKVLL